MDIALVTHTGDPTHGADPGPGAGDEASPVEAAGGGADGAGATGGGADRAGATGGGADRAEATDGGEDRAEADRIAVAGRDDRSLVSALVSRDVRVHRPAWDDPDVEWATFDLVVLRATGDDPGRRDELVAWAERVGATTRLRNPADVIRWNSHRSYLLELEERGAPVVPTAWLGRGDAIDLAELLAARGWHDAVIRPAVPGLGHEPMRVRVDAGGGPAATVLAAATAGAIDLAADLPAGQHHLDALLAVDDVLVQPFLASGAEEGELSVVLFGGQVSHAVRRRPTDRDRRVAEPIDTEVAALAHWVVEATGVADLLLARVDLLTDSSGTWQLVALNATAPALFLAADPLAAERAADALVAEVGG
jgi:hypothetical protein